MKFTVLAKLKTKQAREVRQGIEQMLAPHQNRVYTIAIDNGPEFTEHLKNGSNARYYIYFAHPYEGAVLDN